MKLSRLRKITWRLVFVYSLIVALVVFAVQDEQKYLRGWFWTGFGIVAVGEWVRTWAAGHLVKNKVLTVTGPYAYVKNPLYIGTFLCMVGFAFMAKGDPTALWWLANMNWILLGIAVLGFVAYYVPYKKKREGSRLHDIFGDDWDHYDKAVPDYIPRLTRYERASNAPWSWTATCENSEQWTPFAIAAGTLALLFNKQLIEFVMSAVGKITG
jgi:protein-S-isoprenylcysteine O-methyltransferase Ste14